MENLLYRVGALGYYTTCRTLESAKRQKGDHKYVTITPYFEDVIENSKPTGKRAKMLRKYGFVKRGLTI